MAVETIQVQAFKCECDHCDHVWVTLATRLPVACPACKHRTWNGNKKLGRTPSSSLLAQLPKPVRLRG